MEPRLKEIPKTDGSLPYLLYMPEETSHEAEPRPLLLFLHGMGERGNDLGSFKKEGLPRFIEEGLSFPFVVLAPQCPEPLS
jgi:predicted peptidase